MVVSGVVLITSSLYVRRVRCKHLSAIRKRNLYFGVHGETFNFLISMANAMKEMVYLNIITAVLLIVGNGMLLYSSALASKS